MTEREFERIIEHAADKFEHNIEAAADRFDKGITRKWNHSRLFRICTRTTSLIAEISLIIGARYLSERGYKTVSMICFILGVLGIVAGIVRIFIFKREK